MPKAGLKRAEREKERVEPIPKLVPHIPLPFDEVMADVLKIAPPKKAEIVDSLKAKQTKGKSLK
jgi:hypothetical protein